MKVQLPRLGSVQCKFNALVKDWQRARQGSSTAPLVDDAYGQIVAMGQEAIPMLLREVEKGSGHWFTALKWITAADVVTNENRHSIKRLKESWLAWGLERGYMNPED